MLDICIIGAGASGLAAVIIAAQENPELSIMILEKKDVPGKKLSATGNGKCNLTNTKCANIAETLLFFDTIGIYTRVDEEGRVYPYCSQAKDVVYALTKAAEVAGVKISTNCTLEKIEKKEDFFKLQTNKGTFEAHKVLIATGGKSAPQFGTSGDGYSFARSFGHTVQRLSPVLTGIETVEDLQEIKGVRIKALVRLLKDGKELENELGEVQFNADGISGICVMNLTRFIKLEEDESFKEGIQRYSIELDFIPEMDQIQLENFLKRRGSLGEKDLLLSILPEQLRYYIAKQHNLQNGGLCKLAKTLKNYHFSIKGTKGWKQAQCTSGGVILEEINMDTMESLKIKDLYFSGEVIDFDGPCGGYNLQNAWETGIKAGRAMAHV